MGICKIRLVLIASIAVLSSCRRIWVSQDEYDDLAKEYEELKQAVEDAQDSNVRQAVLINQTLNELASISGKTEIFISDIERGSARLSQAEQISQSITTIKNKIEQLENSSSEDKGFARIVQNLKTIVREKEKEIERLKQIIQEQEGTIISQDGTISEQSDTIRKQIETIKIQADRLKDVVAQQARLLNRAGRDFEDMGDEIPEVSRKKNREKVESWAESMYSTAINYYRQAGNSGHEESYDDIKRVEYKLNRLRH